MVRGLLEQVRPLWLNRALQYADSILSNKTKNLQRVILGMGPFMMNQWSGINVLCYYLAYILENYLGFSVELSLVLASVAFTQYAIFSWP